MAIVCLMDLGAETKHVAVAAGLLAKRMRTACHLAQSTRETAASASHRARGASIEDRLAQRAERMRAMAIEAHTHVLPGPAEREVCSLANRLGAALLVVGESRSHHVSDLLAQQTRVPLLVVHQAAPFVNWATDLFPLRVVVALTGMEDVAVVVRAVRRFATAAACEVTVIHVASTNFDAARDRVAALLKRAQADSSWSVVVEPRRGPLASQIVELAQQRGAHMIVTGSRVMSRASRLWQRSVSRRTMAEASCSILCVPTGSVRERRRLRSLLAATDFTPAGDAALKLAAGIAPPGAKLHAVHVLTVVDREDASERALFRLEAATRALGGDKHTWAPHVLPGDDVAHALQAAARAFAVDAVCVGSSKRPSERASGETLSRLMSELQCALMIASAAETET